jgi:hypothetical protein
MPGSKYLASEESLVLDVRKHPIVLAAPFLSALGALIGASLLGTILSPDRGTDWVDTALGLTAAFFLARFGWKLAQWRIDRIVVTDQRVVEVSGLLTRSVASMPLMKVTDMTYRRSPWGRMLGYGELVLESAGQHQGLSRIAYLPYPDDFYRTVTALVTAHLHGPVDPPEASGPEEPDPHDEDDTGPLPRVIL